MKPSRIVSRIAWTILVPFVLVLAVLAVVVIVNENSGDATAAVNDGTVVMARIAFNPPTITVAPGTEVAFNNKDVAPHTVTADDGSIDSGILNPGKSFSVAVNEPLNYHCEIHPSMKAKVLLEG